MADNSKVFTLRIVTVAVFVILAIAGVGFSAYLLVVANSPYMYFTAVLFAILAVISGFFNLIASTTYYRSYFYNKQFKELSKSVKPLKQYPKVAIAVPTYNEDPKVVKDTVLRLLRMDYPKNRMKLFLLDDSTKKDISSELRAFSEKIGIRYIHRSIRSGFKAGALNNFLKYTNAEFITVFDYDEKLKNRRFLKELLPYFQDPKVSYVQTEKSYGSGSIFSDSVSLFDKFFFKFIQPARAMNNTAIFAGSCGIIRASILKKLGGFPEYIIEDTFFSFESDMKDYKSLYIPKVYALGKPIKTFTELAKQQWRYNYGDTQFIKYFLRYKSRKKNISPFSRIDYITHGFGLNYLSVVLLLFTFVSILIVFSAVSFIHITLAQFLKPSFIGLDLEVFGSIAFVMSFLAPIILTKIYFNSIKKGIMVFALNFALVIVRTKAALAALFGQKPTVSWSRPTGKMSGNIIYSLKNTSIEFSIAMLLVGLGTFASLHHNMLGGIWLIWYGFLYLLATIFLYKYG
ncbi:MAG: glycosyltransferase [Candidatus Micrarchaeaceae archaeon]